MITYSLKVVQIRKETPEAVTICFKQPVLKKVKYISGQYLTLIFRINGRRYIRPYSFSSAPEVDPLIEVTIKRVANGIVSNHIIDVVKEGDIIEAMPPMGNFVYPSNGNFTHVYLWGVGSGITPLMSLSKHILFSQAQTRVTLIYGNRNDESTIFLDSINALRVRFAENFNALHFYTKNAIDTTLPYVVQGRIDPSKVLSALNTSENFFSSLHFICGPFGLKESVKRTLADLNTPSENIFSEDFELVKNPKDFEDLKTRNIILSFQGKKVSLEIAKGKSILEVGLDAGLELPYSCQTGTCSSCKSKLIKGRMRMIGIEERRDDLAKDEYLLCCSYPETEEVEIEI